MKKILCKIFGHKIPKPDAFNMLMHQGDINGSYRVECKFCKKEFYVKYKKIDLGVEYEIDSDLRASF